jgi:pyridoxamine 5'-phosphate oxidase
MIEIRRVLNDVPYIRFNTIYKKALDLKEGNIEAICISSYNKSINEVNSRFVNLKYIDGDKWTFFSNYNSLKAKEFKSNQNIAAVFFWKTINTQIRIKGKIFKSSKEISDEHYNLRSQEKNALAYISNQSETINSYEMVISKYDDALKNKDKFDKRPNHWGGYTFTPYYFEFWEGHKSRVNKRDAYLLNGVNWIHSVLQP